jgi:AcrR family transcriptional regulator
MAAATRVIAAQGLEASTAAIAKEGAVSNGSLFTYFETKAELLNQLYMELKAEMAAVALGGMPAGSDVRKQMQHMWTHWLRWATSFPEKRKALARLNVAGEITAESRLVGHQTMAGIAVLLERSRENGPMRHAPLGLVVTLMSAVAEATIDYMSQDPARAEQHSKAGFDALWRMVA